MTHGGPKTPSLWANLRKISACCSNKGNSPPTWPPAMHEPSNHRAPFGMARLPQKYAPFVFGVIQAAITTAVATAIATHQLTEFGLLFLERWAFAWLVAWLTMLPVVILLAPV